MTGAAALLVLALVSGSCSGDDDGDDPTQKAQTPSTTQGKEVALVASAGKVTGKVSAKRRRHAVVTVGRVVDRWFEAAWLDGDYPRARMERAWPAFTRDLAAQARRDKVLTTNAQLARRIDEVRAVRRVVKVDLLGAAGRPVGATARFRLVFDTDGDVTRRVVVTGRLVLTPVQGAWRIFGYDVARSAGAVPTTRKAK